MNDKDTRRKFYGDIDKIVTEVNFKVITCLVRKELFVKYYTYPEDPYHFCFENLLNRIIKHGDAQNLILAEKRGPDLDTRLEAEYEKFCKIGIHKYHAQTVYEKTQLYLKDKKDNINGLQFIDLILSCLARKYLGKENQMVENDICYDPYLKDKIVEKTSFPLVRK